MTALWAPRRCSLATAHSSQKQTGKPEGTLCPVLSAGRSQVCEGTGINVDILLFCPNGQVSPSLLSIQKELQQLGCGMKSVLQRNFQKTPDLGKLCKPGIGRRKPCKGMKLCTSGPVTSPNTSDYFTLLGALQHMANNESTSSPCPKRKQKRKGWWNSMKILMPFWWVLLTQQKDDGPQWRGGSISTTNETYGSEGTGQAYQFLGDRTESNKIRVTLQESRQLDMKEGDNWRHYFEGPFPYWPQHNKLSSLV